MVRKLQSNVLPFNVVKMTQLQLIASLLYVKPLQKSVNVRLCHIYNYVDTEFRKMDLK